MLAKRFFISGRVQGVGFRYFVYREAERIGSIFGFVRNTRDGGVEVYAESDEQRMAELETALKRGPYGAKVAHVEITDEVADGQYPDFRIAH